jgi:hypothetical protein
VRPKKDVIAARVKNDPEIIGIIPSWLLMLLAGWVLEKLLDWLFLQETTLGASDA